MNNLENNYRSFWESKTTSQIKKEIQSLYDYFKPILFEEQLLLFLNKYCNNRAIIDNSLNERY